MLTYTRTLFVFKEKNVITPAQIKLKDRGLSHLMTFQVGPLWATGGHREDTLSGC